MDALQVEGDELIRLIREYKEANGLYPTSLDRIAEVPKGASDWNYSDRDNGTEFRLSIGNYILDRFSLFYSSEKPYWYRDT